MAASALNGPGRFEFVGKLAARITEARMDSRPDLINLAVVGFDPHIYIRNRQTTDSKRLP